MPWVRLQLDSFWAVHRRNAPANNSVEAKEFLSVTLFFVWTQDTFHIYEHALAKVGSKGFEFVASAKNNKVVTVYVRTHIFMLVVEKAR